MGITPCLRPLCHHGTIQRAGKTKATFLSMQRRLNIKAGWKTSSVMPERNYLNGNVLSLSMRGMNGPREHISNQTAAMGTPTCRQLPMLYRELPIKNFFFHPAGRYSLYRMMRTKEAPRLPY